MGKNTFIPEYGFESQAQQCSKAGKFSNKCWEGCKSMAALKVPNWNKPCPRDILDVYGRKFHVGE